MKKSVLLQIWWLFSQSVVSPFPSFGEGGVAESRGGRWIHTYHLPLRGLLLPEGGEWRILSTIKLLLNTIDYQIIIFSINFTTKFEEESKNPIVAPCMKKEL